MDNGELQYTKLIYPEVKQIDEKFTDLDLDSFVRSYEHPIDYGSMIPNYLLFKSCSNSVVLTGDGSDELFGGYKRALESDTQKFDLFMEIPFYHNIRIDRASMHFTKEARSPFLSHSVVKYALLLKREQRTSKKILSDIYRGLIPDICFENKKQPLRYKNNKEENIKLINNKFYKLNK
jgi:asparagine synthase (glutamine-hydrolysing)